MGRFAFLLPAVFLLGIGTPAQENTQTLSVPLSVSAEPSTYSSSNDLMSVPSWLATPSAAAPSATAASSSSDDADAGAAAPPQVVFGIRPNYQFEAYVGYTFIRFYEAPGTTVNTNGFNYSIVYWPKDWIGADGEFVLTLGSQGNYQARFLLGMGGARVRWKPFRQNIEVWAHGLAGATHFTPQTAYGGQGAFAYEVGGGVDLNTGHLRYAIRAGADMVGTRYFNTYQFSPKISIGFVYRF